MQNKQHIKEWGQKWQNFCNDQLPRERFVSDESWRNKMKVCFDKLENLEVNRDIQRLLDWGVLAENIPRTLRKEYGLLTFKVESKIALRIQFFPYHCDKMDKDGFPVVRSGLVFSYYTIHKRLDELLRDVSKEKYHIDEDGLVPNVLNSFTQVQYKEVLRALPDEVFKEACGKKGHWDKKNGGQGTGGGGRSSAWPRSGFEKGVQVRGGICLENSFAPLSDDDDTGGKEERKERVGAAGSRGESR
uniref:Uncharacterized protein n=1 Tax=Chromera velia CCMP2878 TaxID=1169474 RepID=A0A0G4HTM8_9ALVE|eukprot:Cvel_8501.t1-p1 / transcript=Cvel_8501.t1 / gene=Cvel_8501 / organism=Chromera_velia_CCMP2878 / gene_product=hypothetical protein / transcript_product=hypothetical protein / location=Cvel_scaffold470:10673-11714(-) / protein_length=244 / sequence_SO=supercontig / SO=protein_coding / is_pseudo=false